MASSSSSRRRRSARRSKREGRSKSRRSGRSSSRASSRASDASDAASDASAPTYLVEENSRGELVNKQLGVTWPKRVRTSRRYPCHDTPTRPSGTLASTNFEEDQFATSPYEMISISDLDAAAAARRSVTGGLTVRGSRSSRPPCSKPPKKERDMAKYVAGSPQYVQLSSGRSSAESTGSDESLTKIDSVVFNTAEELNRYQRIFVKDSSELPTMAATSTTSVTNTAVNRGGCDRDETDQHYIGVRSRREVDKKLIPGQFYIYYDKPSGEDIPVTIELKLGYMSSEKKIHHFPIQRFECQGDPYYAVMQSDSDVKMFASIALLVKHYHTYSHVDPESGRTETFGLPY